MRKTVYLAASQEAWLADIELNTRKRRNRIPSSAVVRLALDRLQQEMSDEEIEAAIRERAVAPSVGRTRL